MAKAQDRSILIVGGEAAVWQPMAARLEEQGYRCQAVPDAAAALGQFQPGAFQLALIDPGLPDMVGPELVARLRGQDADLVVVTVAAPSEVAVAVESVRAGAFTYLIKPINLDGLALAVERALDYRRLGLENREYQRNLEAHLQRRTQEVNLVLRHAIEALAHALEAKDEYSEGHSRRVAQLAVALGQHLGLSPEEVNDLYLAALLHDVGNIGLREGILSKPDRLTPEEYEHMKTHVEIAVRILEPIEGLKPLIPLVRHHHERYDGLGYPDGLRDEKIPLGARILSLADVHDALISPRPYRSAFSPPMALAIIEGNAGTQFDPRLAPEFVTMLRQPLEASLRHLLNEAASS